MIRKLIISVALIALASLAVAFASPIAATIKSFPPSAFASIYVGSNAHGLTNVGYGCSDKSDAVAGNWTALAGNNQGVAGSSASFAVQGAAIGDDCRLILGAAALASNQSIRLTQTCVVTGANVVKEYIRTPTSATSGSITPKAGKRCAWTYTPL